MKTKIDSSNFSQKFKRREWLCSEMRNSESSAQVALENQNVLAYETFKNM